MKRDESLVVYFMRDESGLLTGRLVERGFTLLRFVARGADAEAVYAELGAQIAEALRENPSELDVFLWEEEVQTARIEVEVRPQLKVEKRSVIGKERIPIKL